MSCNSRIHDELKNMEESTCPFCDRILVEVDKVVESCCSKQNMKNINGMNVCINCGSVNDYEYVNEYIDFYENIHKIRRKSVYHRKYHINNVLNSISNENHIHLTNNQRDRIYKVFVEIDSVIHNVNDGRKRMISIKFILKQLFRMLGLSHNDITITKSKKTLEFYNRYWIKILLLKFDKIITIIRQ